jgi:ribulose-5-phosphate 4-epimerase/fuculose-1-phosphate aldolase
LKPKDILLMDIDGNVLEPGQVSSEKYLHLEIYKDFPQTKAVIHTHPLFTNAYFLERETFVPRVFESKNWLGQIQAVNQTTPSVTDLAPVIEALKKNNVMALRQHGVVAMGQDLFDCFLLVQTLEEAIKTDAFSRLFKKDSGANSEKSCPSSQGVASKTYEMFSSEHIQAIVEQVNGDAAMKQLGEKTGMTMELAVRLQETGQTFSFRFERGKIVSVGNNDQAEFLITANEAVWRDVFEQRIDPFVATTQKRMDLKGDFARISKWYAPCNRLFELWKNVPIK